MYINGILLGVLATLFVEQIIVIIFLISIIYRKCGKKVNHPATTTKTTRI